MTLAGISRTQLDGLGEATPAEEIKHRPGPGGKSLSYVDARFVMDRLDAIVGPEHWQDTYDEMTDGAVRCGIGILVEGDWVWKFDVGVRSDIEPELGAFSHAFKRAAVKWGIARDLYGHTSTPVATRPASAPRPVSSPAPDGGIPEEPEYLREAETIFADVRTGTQDRVATQDGFCPDHGLGWVLRPGGISKTTGKAYDAFWSCPSQDRPFCKQKPSARWAAMHEGGAA